MGRGVGLVMVLGLGGCLASVDQVCDKCASCLASDPDFAEGWCADFQDFSQASEPFDRSDCAAGGDLDDLDLPVFAGEIAGMSCDDFDDRI